jgi:hypothetical protein
VYVEILEDGLQHVYRKSLIPNHLRGVKVGKGGGGEGDDEEERER